MVALLVAGIIITLGKEGLHISDVCLQSDTFIKDEQRIIDMMGLKFTKVKSLLASSTRILQKM